MKNRYDHEKVEKKWQSKWLEEEMYYPKKMKSVKRKQSFYNLWMFPYPSAEGLHAGHVFASTGGDIYGRYKRMNGKSVFQPIGYDSFGIHTENFAIKKGIHPQKILRETTKHYEKQLKSLGHGYDWTRTVTTSERDYYRWTQWLFVQMFKAGLAYRRKSEVNWCPSCKTVLADEQVINKKVPQKVRSSQRAKVKRDDTADLESLSAVSKGETVSVCERCETEVEMKILEQWHFRITDYADRLLNNLEKINWPEKIKIAQRNWIGKKDGINIAYPVKGNKKFVTVFTTAPVNFGATFIVVAPEYAKKELLKIIPSRYEEEVKKYIKTALNKSKQQRFEEGAEKTGVFTGLYAINHVTKKEIPIWITEFVLYDVGTGAVQGCPGHDIRDFLFAKKFGLPIVRVIVGSDGYDGPIEKEKQVIEHGMEGRFVNSEFLNGLGFEEGLQKTMDYFEEKGWGKRETHYHLRDWIISRQRYWGPPIPMIYCKKCAFEGRTWFNDKRSKTLHLDQSNWEHAGWWPEENLPVELPYISDYKPEGAGKGPLANHREFYETKCPECGGKADRETDVSDTFLDSAWYFLRYPSVRAGEQESRREVSISQRSNVKSQMLPWDPEITKKWLPVDLYFGGAEHAVLHLMYARFVTMMLFDLKYIEFSEPFPNFYAHGLMVKDGAKMSKSRGNVVNPDEYIEKFGADTLRLYLMFMGPMDGYPDFRDTGIEGMRRFVERVWDLFVNYKDIVLIEEKDSREVLVKMHQTIKKVTKDIQEFRYNTAIAAIMEYVNLLRDLASKNQKSKIKNQNHNSKLKVGRTDHKSRIRCAEWDEALKSLALLLAPFTPHIAEEMYQFLRKSQFSKSKFQTNSKVKSQKFESVHLQPWPEYNLELTKEAQIAIVVQVNGKLRDTILMDRGSSKDKNKTIELARKQKKVQKWLKGKQIRDTFFVPGRLVNFVTE